MDALTDRIDGHAHALERGHRSPLYVALMRGKAENTRIGGVVNDIFPDGPGAPGSVPELRLMAALHHLVLAGDAPELTTSDCPLAWLTMESISANHLTNFTLPCRLRPDGLSVDIAETGSHGPPVRWRPTPAPGLTRFRRPPSLRLQSRSQTPLG